jgi:predicted transcriptional regulator
MGMRMEKDLSEGPRETLARLIEENPGISFLRITDRSGMNRGTLRYHLDILEKEGRVRVVHKGKKKLYYASGKGMKGPLGEEDDLTRGQRRILNLIKENPGVSKHQLISITGQNREEVRYALRKLTSRSEVWKVTDGHDPTYEYITRNKLAKEMLALILEKFLNDEMDRETFLLLKKRIEEDL